MLDATLPFWLLPVACLAAAGLIMLVCCLVMRSHEGRSQGPCRCSRRDAPVRDHSPPQ